jgi:endonuclease-8
LPEGHTIHRVARDQRKRFAGDQLEVDSPQGRFSDGARQLNGRVLQEIDAYGKHLFYTWEGDRLLHVHLGLYGKFTNYKSPAPEPRGAVRLRVVGPEHGFDLRGPTACELITAKKRASILDRLGADPLRPDADPEPVWERICKSRAAIGRLLLDQSVIAGVGNVYRAEVLFETRIHPDRTGQSLSRGEFDSIWDTLVHWLHIGVKYNRIITVDPDDVGKTRGRMNREERLQIYKKSHCPECHSDVGSWDLGARTIYACQTCQI